MKSSTMSLPITVFATPAMVGDTRPLSRPPTVLLELSVDPPKKAEGDERFGMAEEDELVLEQGQGMGITRLPSARDSGGATGRKMPMGSCDLN